MANLIRPRNLAKFSKERGVRCVQGEGRRGQYKRIHRLTNKTKFEENGNGLEPPPPFPFTRLKIIYRSFQVCEDLFSKWKLRVSNYEACNIKRDGSELSSGWIKGARWTNYLNGSASDSPSKISPQREHNRKESCRFSCRSCHLAFFFSDKFHSPR